ncbi:MAG: ABC transporter ATP-binding protein [Gammaproteobacteria bacterium]|nr:ABC transporter ATP-binding protein [Gammaproteobacteria bacterium]
MQETASTSSVAVHAAAVSKVFGTGVDEVHALRNVSLDIHENEFFTLLGPSGCGKTTLLRLIAGFDEPTDGHIDLHGQALTGLPPYRRPVNTVFQSYALFPHLSVARNVSFGLEMLGTESGVIDSRVREMLELVRLADYGNRKPAQLSGGQQQRVALARALANQPRVLLLDEPLSALDLKLRKDMQLELKRLQSETGITFIFVTHDQEEALTMSDRLAVMNDGRVLQVGTPSDIYEHPSTRFVADFIGDTNFLPAERVADGNGGAQYRLRDTGAIIAADRDDAAVDSAEVTLAVRPERAELLADNREAAGTIIDGTLGNVVYFGTDTIFHLKLENGADFRVRAQNHAGARIGLEPGSAVRVHIPRDAVRVLAE